MAFLLCSCREVVGFVCVSLSLPPQAKVLSFGFHCCGQNPSMALARGCGHGRPSSGRRAPVGAEPRPPGEGRGRMQERRQLSSCRVSILLRPFSRLGRTKTLPCELWSSTQHPHRGLRGAPTGQLLPATPPHIHSATGTRKDGGPPGWEPTRSSQGAVRPVKRGENKVPVNCGLCLSVVDVLEGTLWKPQLPSRTPPLLGVEFHTCLLIVD